MGRSTRNRLTLFISTLGALTLGLLFALPPTSGIPSASVSKMDCIKTTDELFKKAKL